MVWGCFAASGPGQLAIINGKMISQVYLQENVRLSVLQFHLNRSLGMQQEIDPEVNQQQDGFNRIKSAFWSGPVRVLTSTRLRCCGMTSSEQFTPSLCSCIVHVQLGG